MAWISHGDSNDSLIDKMKENGLIISERVEQVSTLPLVVMVAQNSILGHWQAMKQVDRGNYVRLLRSAYMDAPSSIDYGG